MFELNSVNLIGSSLYIYLRAFHVLLISPKVSLNSGLEGRSWSLIEVSDSFKAFLVHLNYFDTF